MTAFDYTEHHETYDSRDIISRLEQLQLDKSNMTVEDWESDPDLQTELDALEDIDEQGRTGVTDWEYGEALISDYYFQEYARELAEDIGAIDRNANWPLHCIDWEQAANELKHDYSRIDIDGRTYFARQ